MKGGLKLKKFFGEFKTFAVKGNMIDLAIGILVGGAFSKIVSSLVADVATPLIGILMGVDFSSWEIELPRLFGQETASIMKIGVFLNNVLDFLIIAFTVFLFVKAMNKIRANSEAKAAQSKPAEPETPPAPTKEEVLLTEIRDILKERRD